VRKVDRKKQVCSIIAILRLYYGTIKALLGLHYGSIRALLRWWGGVQKLTKRCRESCLVLPSFSSPPFIPPFSATCLRRGVL
jgi:hypothetical protein